MKSVLTIAGSDSSGGAGIQADIKTIEANGVFATSAITAITAQNTCGVRSVQNIEPKIVADQIDAVFEDIRPSAVKIGMVSSVEIIQTIAERLRFHAAENVVLDPVMVATSGARLIEPDAICALQKHLLPLASVVTPNLPEAEVLCDFTISSQEACEKAAKKIAKTTNGAVLIKGGHSKNSADDYLLLQNGEGIWLRANRIETTNTHGSGCTLSSAIAAGLAKGLCTKSAVKQAKEYVRGAMAAGLDLGHGSGPLQHMWQFANKS